MYSDTLIDASTTGTLYYALIGVDAAQPVNTHVLENLGVDLAANRENDLSVRASSTRSIVFDLGFLEERHTMPDGQSGLWQVFLFPNLGTMFDEPLADYNTERQLIFPLPNGFLGFLIADTNGRVADVSSQVFEPVLDDPIVQSAISCSACHAYGIIGVQDEVRPVWDSLVPTNSDLLERVRTVYPQSEQFEQFVSEDNERFQRSLLEAGLPTNIADPVWSVLRQFENNLYLEKAAADLGITAEFFSERLGELAPRFSPLVSQGASLSRDDFSEVFLPTLCTLHDSSQNKPAASACGN